LQCMLLKGLGGTDSSCFAAMMRRLMLESQKIVRILTMVTTSTDLYMAK